MTEPEAPPALETIGVAPDLGPEDVTLLLGTVPERVADVVAALDGPRLAYRHGPAFPTLGEVVSHLCEAGTAVDSLLRHAYLDKQRELHVRATIDPPPAAPELARPVADLLEGFGRIRRRTVDLLRGLTAEDWGTRLSDPEQGDLTLLEVCRQVTYHELGHLAQLRNLTSLLPDA